MELPFETDDDKAKIEQFKTVLSQVLQYEKTQCPFRQSFEVDLPERPKTPPRKRPTVEGKLNLLGRLPHYVSVDQKTYGRYGVLPSTSNSPGVGPGRGTLGAANGIAIGPVGSTQRLGP